VNGGWFLNGFEFKTIHGEQAGKRVRGGLAVGARHIVREHDKKGVLPHLSLASISAVAPAFKTSWMQLGALPRATSSRRVSLAVVSFCHKLSPPLPLPI
jgi:hypothetical protein